jgi:hypothetical protein
MKFNTQAFYELIGVAKNDIIDAEFIQSDLKDVYLTDAEKSEISFYDSMANRSDQSDPGIPLGKTVL